MNRKEFLTNSTLAVAGLTSLLAASCKNARQPRALPPPRTLRRESGSDIAQPIPPTNRAHLRAASTQGHR